jgi:DNA-binding LytR/AlgR family response regulator
MEENTENTGVSQNCIPGMNSERLVLIVEDEVLIAEHITRVLKTAGYTNSFYVSSVDEALAFLEINSPQIVLTDIMLNGEKTGVELGEMLKNRFKIPFIYITSHSGSDFVAKLMHTRPNAYLVKPFKKEDLLIAMELALFNAEPPITEHFLQIKDGHAVAQIPYDEILWLEAEGNYTIIYSKSMKRRLLRTVITELHRQLPAADFIRIHRSYVVKKTRISEFNSTHVVIEGTKIPIGRTYRESINELVKI